MTPTKTCPECGGTGIQTYERVVRASFSNPQGYIEEYEDDCDNCGGMGIVDDDDFDDEEDE